MASLLFPSDVRAHFETDLSDVALQRHIDAVEEEIIDLYGPHALQIDELKESRLSTHLFLTREVTAISEIIETLIDDGARDDTTLSADDYHLSVDGWRIQRLSDGTNPRATWGDEIVVTYTPSDETSKRENVLLTIVKLDIQFNGLDSERVGDYSAAQKDYEGSRTGALGRLSRLPLA